MEALDGGVGYSPTAPDDALRTEYALFERYARSARDAARRTETVIVLVSYRSSSVRTAWAGRWLEIVAARPRPRR